MKAWRRSGGLGPPASSSPGGYLNALAATNADGVSCVVNLDGVSLTTVSDATGFTVNGAACDTADIFASDNFVTLTRAAGLNVGDTIAYNGTGGIGSIINAFSLVAS